MFNGIRVTTKKVYVAEDNMTAEVVEVICGRRKNDVILNAARWGYKNITELLTEHYTDYDVVYL